MANKRTNKRLIGIFAVLLMVVSVVKFWPGQNWTSTFDDQLIKAVDTGKLTRLVMLPEFDTADQVILVKASGQWRLKRGQQHKPVNPKRLKRSLADLNANLKATRLVSRDKADWADYKVDSSGTLLKIYQSGALHDEVVLGKMNFRNGQTAVNYARNKAEQSIYALEAYLGGSLKGTPSDWLKGDKGSAGKGISPAARKQLQRRRMQQRKGR